MSLYEGAGALLDDLLVPSLNRAFPLAEVDRLSLTIAKNLNLYMMAIRIKAFHEDPSVLEQRFTSGHDRRICLPDLCCILASGQTHTPTASSRLQHHWEAETLSRLDSIFFAIYQTFGAGHNGYASFSCEFTSGMLDTEGLNARRRRSDPGETGRGDRASEYIILAQKPVARNDSICVVLLRYLDDSVAVTNGKRSEKEIRRDK